MGPLPLVVYSRMYLKASRTYHCTHGVGRHMFSKQEITNNDSLTASTSIPSIHRPGTTLPVRGSTARGVYRGVGGNSLSRCIVHIRESIFVSVRKQSVYELVQVSTGSYPLRSTAARCCADLQKFPSRTCTVSQPATCASREDRCVARWAKSIFYPTNPILALTDCSPSRKRPGGSRAWPCWWPPTPALGWPRRRRRN